VSTHDDTRLIEDYLPIQAISAEASREKSVRKGHISTLHLWWARRPLVACRAAVYGALVPMSRFRPKNGPEEKRDSLARANAAKFVEGLCKYPGAPHIIAEAEQHILEAHAERLTEETGQPVTVEDIREGRAPRPKVLDMFAGGGSIPLEALRLGCEAHALDLNPVAHIIELCTLVYPQEYGKPDPALPGMTGPEDSQGQTTWGGLADEVRHWGNWVLEKVRAEIGDLYPFVPDMDWWAGLPGRHELSTPLFPGTASGVSRTRRHLPHWEREGACYFVTYRVAAGLELSPEARDAVLENLRHFSGERYDLWQCVVMPDHVHALLSPLPKGDGSFWTLSEILHSAKSYTANRANETMGREGPLWQEERFDHIVRGPASFEHKWHYIRQNPCKAGLAEKPEAYPWLHEDAGLAGRPTLTPVAYLWTRTVTCKNPSCGATVPLVKQTWLCRKSGKNSRYVAMRMVTPAGGTRVRFEIVEAPTEAGLGFDPSLGSKGGNTECPFCRGPVDSDYVKAEGCSGRMGQQMMALVCTRPGKQGKVYLPADDYPEFVPDDEAIRQRIAALCDGTGLTVPDEEISPVRPSPNARGLSAVTRHGLRRFADLYTPRQMLCLLSFAAAVRRLSVGRAAQPGEHGAAVATYLACVLDKQVDFNSSLCVLKADGGRAIVHTFGRQALPMVWDFAEANPFNAEIASWASSLDEVVANVGALGAGGSPEVVRGSATSLPWPDASLDAVITDPPYYDNVPYADISDFFYVWLKRTIGHVHPEHFSAAATPKKAEVTALSSRHSGDMTAATAEYEAMMAASLSEAHRVLRPDGEIAVVYAHKTTLGWSTLVDALRRGGFTVTEAWPMDTETRGRLVAQETSALASSIFLVARKRDGATTGLYEEKVRPELEAVVRERVASLWDMGITGADLVIAAVGAGLRAFTRFGRVEYANGEEVPAERFLAEVEGVVLETLLERIFNVPRSGVASVDGPSRFYVLWRYTYGAAEMDAGEAIVFTYGQNVELDGPDGLSAGARALVEKRKAAYRLRDFTERGGDDKLGLPDDDTGSPAPLIDVLHRILWLIENEPRNLNVFLDESDADRERLRLVAQALAGPGLRGTASLLGPAEVAPAVVTTVREQSALGKLLANWRSLIESRLGFLDGSLFDPTQAAPAQGTLSLDEEE